MHAGLRVAGAHRRGSGLHRGSSYGWWYWDDWGLGWRSPAEHGSAAATGLDMVVFGVAAIGVIKCYHDVYRCGATTSLACSLRPPSLGAPRPFGRLLSPSASLLKLLRNPSRTAWLTRLWKSESLRVCSWLQDNSRVGSEAPRQNLE